MNKLEYISVTGKLQNNISENKKKGIHKTKKKEKGRLMDWQQFHLKSQTHSQVEWL